MPAERDPPTPEEYERARRAIAATPFIETELQEILRSLVNDMCKDGITQAERDDIRADMRAVKRLGQRCGVAVVLGEPGGKN